MKMRLGTYSVDRRVLAVLLLLLAPTTAPCALAQASFDVSGGNELVGLINQARAHAGVPPLVVDNRLTQAACRHTALLAKHKVLSHQFDGEPLLAMRFMNENLRSGRQAENIVWDESTVAANAALMNSPDHSTNILNPTYNAVGVCALPVGERVYVTEDFAERLPDLSDAEAEAALEQAIAKQATASGMVVPSPKPQPQLSKMACDMAQNDTLDPHKAAAVPGAQDVFAWTATDLNALPGRLRGRLAKPVASGYSLGACFAPSASHPGGSYWVVMVTY